MEYEVIVEVAHPLPIAAVRATVPIRGVAQAWKPALDQVWTFLKKNGGLQPSHNVFLYHHPSRRDEPMDIDFGVQLARVFDSVGNILCVETPSGEVAGTIHVGPYDKLGEAHNAIHAWCAANKRRISATSWEIYGDWNDNPALLETTIKYLLT
jgi:effector-binding domain-containing protein